MQTRAIRGARWIIISLLLALSTWLGMEAGGDGLLVNEAAPFGIVSLEFAATPERARRVVASWENKALRDRGEPRRSIYFDFAFALVYANLLALCCLMAAEAMGRSASGLARAGVLLAWAQYAAGLFDVIENCALLKMLPAGPQQASAQFVAASPWPEIAALFAGLKFIIIGLGLLYILTGLMLFAAGLISLKRHAARTRVAGQTNPTS
jgi:hypothetical protein